MGRQLATYLVKASWLPVGEKAANNKANTWLTCNLLITIPPSDVLNNSPRATQERSGETRS